jgi:hypothetical protein
MEARRAHKVSMLAIPRVWRALAVSTIARIGNDMLPSVSVGSESGVY